MSGVETGIGFPLDFSKIRLTFLRTMCSLGVDTVGCVQMWLKL